MKKPNQNTNPNTAISVQNMSKSFKVPTEARNSIKNLFVSAFKKNEYNKLDILKNISFNVEHGEFFGIVGRNGSGKSTLLKLLAGIYTPDKGQVHISGRLTPFIELGVGFNPELTGRENVYLNGALLGFSRKEMAKIYPRIVDFAELEEFMDQKLKNYSSGMQVRLAFSIAIQAESDILLFDEVLAVGDASFQRKCFDTFEQYKADNKTVILVTHDMENVRKFCSSALLLHEGKIIEMGDPNKIAAAYDKLNQENIDQFTDKNNQAVVTKSKIRAKITDSRGKERSSFEYGETMTVRLTWQKEQRVKNLGLAIMKEGGEFIFGRNTLNFKDKSTLIGRNSYGIEIKLTIGYGRYYLMYGAFGETRLDVIEFVSRGPSFIVTVDQDADWEGLASLNNKWLK